MKQVLYFDDDNSILLEEKSPDNMIGYYRAAHDTERVNIDLEDDRYIPNTPQPWGKGRVRKSVRDLGKALPEVYRFYPHHSVILTEPLQHLWYGINAELSKEKWRTLLGSTLAFTNNSSGYGGSERHADYINQRDLDCSPPSFDFIRYTGGAIFKGKRVNDNVLIEYINIFRSLPTAAQLLSQRHLWFYATSINPLGRVWYMQKLGMDGTLKKIRIPLFATHDIYLPANELHYLKQGENYDANVVVYKG